MGWAAKRNQSSACPSVGVAVLRCDHRPLPNLRLLKRKSVSTGFAEPDFGKSIGGLLEISLAIGGCDGLCAMCGIGRDDAGAMAATWALPAWPAVITRHWSDGEFP